MMTINNLPKKTQKTELSIRAEAQFGGRGLLVIEHDLLDQLTDWVRNDSQTAVARELGIKVPTLNPVLHGKRGVSGRLADRLGWERVTVFVKR